jgi:large subunit ribosomal protein L22
MSQGHRSAIKRSRNRAEGVATFRAVQRNARISPSKVRPSVDLIRGKRVEDALHLLGFELRRGSAMLRKVLQSAVANATSRGGLDPLDLRVTRATVDEGLTFSRWHARARGRVGEIIRRNSHITVEVATA